MNILFGAGKVGKIALGYFRAANVQIDYFCDNSDNLINSQIDGISIIKPCDIQAINEDLTVYITVRKTEGIEEQIRKYANQNTKILLCNEFDLILEHAFKGHMEYPGKRDDSKKCFLDLTNGLALGGVETWSIQQMNELNQNDIPTKLMVNRLGRIEIEVEQENIIDYEISLFPECNDFIDFYKEMLTCSKVVIVSNFIGAFFIMACKLKNLWPENITHYAVVHSDEACYFEFYPKYAAYIDKCFTISNMLRNKLLQQCFDEKKISTLTWKLPHQEIVDRRHLVNQKLRIGFAGRLNVTPKRVDLILKLIELLDDKNIEFVFSIVGFGECEHEIKSFIKTRQKDNVRFLGQLEHDDINDFWLNQDVMISCSIWEGHSITQCEAMSAGAVPVVTDVSGVRDDIIDGENGFIVPVGDIEAMSKRIEELYIQPDMLVEMSKAANRTINEKYTSESVFISNIKAI